MYFLQQYIFLLACPASQCRRGDYVLPMFLFYIRPRIVALIPPIKKLLRLQIRWTLVQ